MRRGGGNAPTITKWVEGWEKGEDGSRFVRSRLVARDLVARDFKPKREENPGEMFAAMPPLEAKKLLFRMAAGVRGWRKRKGAAEIKLMFIDVRKAHLNAVCDEEAWVELPEEFLGMWPLRQVEEMVIRHEKGSSRLGGGVREEVRGGRIQEGSRGAHRVL